eukprot:6782475-Pyramimonas_sp.AAC.1
MHMHWAVLLPKGYATGTPGDTKTTREENAGHAGDLCAYERSRTVGRSVASVRSYMLARTEPIIEGNNATVRISFLSFTCKT